jgi:peptide/nickel transport system substrate-binding protein
MRVEKILFILALALLAPMFVFSGGQQPTVEEEAPEPGPTMGKFNEAPMLAAMVEAGELPPVDERLPEDVFIVTPIEEVGKYGGTIQVFATDPNPWNDMQWGAGLSDGFFRMTKEGNALEVNLAKEWKLADDHMTFTIYMREGVKWSDGEPLTADDSMFWYMDMVKGPGGYSTWNPISFRDATKLDDYTVRLNFNDPNPQIIAQMSQWPSWVMFQPKHFLQKWHIKYNDKAEELAVEEGFETWQQAFQSHYWWAPQKELDLPKINPWLLKQSTSTNLLFERNPYYWKIDTAGNQLPYIDNISVQIIDGEVYSLKVISGEADYAYTGTNFDNFTLYKENEGTGNYRTILMPGAAGSQVTFGFNMTHDDPEIRKLFQDKRFRQAVSVAMNREDINKSVYLGQGVPRQSMVLPSVSYYKEEWGNSYAQYDPALANRLLDAVGLDKKDGDGFRLLPSGKALLIPIEYSGGDDVTKVLEIVKEYWDDVGVKTVVKYQEGAFFHDREALNDHMLRVATTPWADEMSNYAQGARGFANSADIINNANRWHRWYSARATVDTLKRQITEAKTDEDKTKFQEDLEKAEQAFQDAVDLLPQGEEPPQEYIQLREWFTERGQHAMGSKTYMDISRKIYDFHAENLYTIGTVGMLPKPFIAKNRLGNATTSEYVNRAVLPYGITGYFYQFYLKD